MGLLLLPLALFHTPGTAPRRPSHPCSHSAPTSLELPGEQKSKESNEWSRKQSFIEKLMWEAAPGLGILTERKNEQCGEGWDQGQKPPGPSRVQQRQDSPGRREENQRRDSAGQRTQKQWKQDQVHMSSLSGPQSQPLGPLSLPHQLIISSLPLAWDHSPWLSLKCHLLFHSVLTLLGIHTGSSARAHTALLGPWALNIILAGIRRIQHGTLYQNHGAGASLRFNYGWTVPQDWTLFLAYILVSNRALSFDRNVTFANFLTFIRNC